MGLAHYHGHNFGRRCLNSVVPVEQLVSRKVPVMPEKYKSRGLRNRICHWKKHILKSKNQ